MALLPKDAKAQRQILIALIPLVLAAGYYQFVHSGRKLEIEELDAAVSDLKTRNDAMAAIIARHGADLPQRLAIYEEHVKRLEQLIPRREDVPQLISRITQSAHSLGVELAGLNPSGEVPGEHYSSASYELQVLGDYHRIGEYLAAIGSLDRIIRPARLMLNIEGSQQQQAPGEGPLLRARFRIETYISPSEPTAPTGAEAGSTTNAN
jgi:type IV pilus assembly protein PilO